MFMSVTRMFRDVCEQQHAEAEETGKQILLAKPVASRAELR